jgi:hypothetical protein
MAVVPALLERRSEFVDSLREVSFEHIVWTPAAQDRRAPRRQFLFCSRQILHREPNGIVNIQGGSHASDDFT